MSSASTTWWTTSSSARAAAELGESPARLPPVVKEISRPASVVTALGGRDSDDPDSLDGMPLRYGNRLGRRPVHRWKGGWHGRCSTPSRGEGLEHGTNASRPPREASRPSTARHAASGGGEDRGRRVRHLQALPPRHPRPSPASHAGDAHGRARRSAGGSARRQGRGGGRPFGVRPCIPSVPHGRSTCSSGRCSRAPSSSGSWLARTVPHRRRR